MCACVTEQGVVGAPGNLHGNFIFSWLCLSAGSEHSVTQIIFNGIMSITCATELMTKFHEEHHIVRGLNLFEWQFMLLEPSSGL